MIFIGFFTWCGSRLQEFSSLFSFFHRLFPFNCFISINFKYGKQKEVYMKKGCSLIMALGAIVWSHHSFAANVSTWVDLEEEFNDSVAIDKNGNVYVSHVGFFSNGGGTGTTLFKVNADGVVSDFADIPRVGGNSVDADNNIYVNGQLESDDVVFRFTPEGQRSVFSQESGVVQWNSKGEAFAVNYGAGKIFSVDSNGQFTDFSTDSLLNGPISIVFDQNDQMYAANFNDGRIMRIDENGNATSLASVPNGIGYMTIMSGNLYATGFNARRIYKISFDGEIEAIAGSGISGSEDGEGEAASFARPNGIAAMPDGETLVVSEYAEGATKLRLVTVDREQIQFANDDELSVDEDTPVTFNPLENDDGFGSSLNQATLTIAEAPVNGEVSVNTQNGEVTYSPTLDYFGEDQFTYTVETTSGDLSSPATVAINVDPIADEPHVSDDAFDLDKNTNMKFDVLANDLDVDGGELSYQNVSVVNAPSSGQVTVNDDGLTYQPNQDFVGQDMFSYTVSNANGLTSIMANVNITVNDVSDPVTPDIKSNSSGGGLNSFLLLILAAFGLQRRLAK
jgi:sugar lactone lactonase YvrE